MSLPPWRASSSLKAASTSPYTLASMEAPNATNACGLDTTTSVVHHPQHALYVQAPIRPPSQMWPSSVQTQVSRMPPHRYTLYKLQINHPQREHVQVSFLHHRQSLDCQLKEIGEWWRDCTRCLISFTYVLLTVSYFLCLLLSLSFSLCGCVCERSVLEVLCH